MSNKNGEIYEGDLEWDGVGPQTVVLDDRWNYWFDNMMWMLMGIMMGINIGGFLIIYFIKIWMGGI